MATREKRGEQTRPRDDSSGLETEQETANRLFLQHSELLPGVLRVEQHRDTSSGERSFRIYVRHGDRSAQEAVYQLEAEIYRLYPLVYLDAWVTADSDVTPTAGDPRIPAP